MNILLVVHQFLPNLAGTEIHTLNLARALAERHNVLVYYRDHADRTPGFHGIDDTVEGLPVRRISLNLTGLRRNRYREFIAPYRNPEIERDFSVTLERFRPDVVHFQHLMYLSARLVGIAHRRGVPTVMTLNDFWSMCSRIILLRYTGELCTDNAAFRACADCVSRRPRRGVVRWLMARLLRQRDRLLRDALHSADAIIAPAQFLKDKFVRDGYVVADKTRVIEYGIDTANARPHRQRSDGDPLRFAYIGTLVSHKGVHVLVKAFNSVEGAATLDIYGSPDTYPTYSAELRQQIKHPEIRLRGKLARSDLWRTLSEIDAIVVPSLWYENSPVIIQESLAAGVPVITSDLGGMREKIQDAVTGFLFPAGDHLALAELIQRLVDNPAQLNALRQRNGPVVSVGENASQIEAIYSTLCDGT